jgi:hypothetical protein
MDKGEEEEQGSGMDAAWSGGACEALFTGLEAGRQWRDGVNGLWWVEHVIAAFKARRRGARGGGGYGGGPRCLRHPFIGEMP